MNRSVKTRLPWLALLVLGIPFLASAESLPTQKVGFLAFALPEYPATIFVRTGRESFEEVELFGANTTAMMDVVCDPESESIRIYGRPEQDEEGKMVHPVIGSARTSLKWKQAFVILAGKKKGERVTYGTRVFPVSDQDFPEGTLKFANFSKSPIEGLLGKGNVVKVEPGAIETLRYKKPPGESIGVVFMYRQEETRQWRRMIATRWAVPAKGRRIMLAYEDPESHTIRTKTLPIRR